MTDMLFPDIPRLYTALAEWLACIVYLSQLPLRFRGWKLAGICGGMLVIQSIFMTFTGNLPIVFWMPCMAVAVGLMFLFLMICTSTGAVDAGYTCMRAFILAEFAASLEWQLYFYGAYRMHWEGFGIRLTYLAVVYTAVFGLVFYLENARCQKKYHINLTRQAMWGAVAIGVGVFLISNLSYAYQNTPFGGKFVIDILNTRTMVDLGGVAILYAYHMQRAELYMRYELSSIQNVLKNQYAQYRQSRESIEIINRKYHDLKHLIAALRAESDPTLRSKWLDEMEADIKTYEAQNKTGNPVLDTVLTSKSLYCQKHGIQLTCVADGTKLSGMDAVDICTIFGNALDNAIECELQLEDKAKRLIHVTVTVQKGFLLMRFENYYEGHLEFSEGLPVTSKNDDAYHGFGIKSIRYTAEKYDGRMKISTDDHWFELRVLIPLSNLEKTQ